MGAEFQGSARLGVVATMFVIPFPLGRRTDWSMRDLHFLYQLLFNCSATSSNCSLINTAIPLPTVVYSVVSIFFCRWAVLQRLLHFRSLPPRCFFFASFFSIRVIQSAKRVPLLCEFLIYALVQLARANRLSANRDFLLSRSLALDVQHICDNGTCNSLDIAIRNIFSE